MPNKKTKITQNINKDAGLLDLPKVKPINSQWETRSSNYISSNIGDIVPIFVDEVMPSERRRVTMGMISHMTTPLAPIFNAQYTEFRAFFVPHRLSADLLAGYKTRKSPFVKVFGEDNASSNAKIVVPLAQQVLPTVSGFLENDFYANHEAFGGVADALDMGISTTSADNIPIRYYNFLSMAAYELIYQKAYRNQNRESATESNLYKYLFDLYNRTSSASISYKDCDKFHEAQREKDYFTGSSPFTLKGEPLTVNVGGNVPINAVSTATPFEFDEPLMFDTASISADVAYDENSQGLTITTSTGSSIARVVGSNLVADLSSAQGVDIETLRILIKTQELLEKDMMYGSDYASSLNAHFGTAPISTELQEPLELKKVTITSRMQPIFQTSSTAGEESILGQIGANATTQTDEFEIVPWTKFEEWGYIVICACHKAQNSYDATLYKPKHLFKTKRFDWFTPELDDLGFQPVSRLEFNHESYDSSSTEAVSYNEAYSEYRYKFNKVHGMFEPSRSGALDYWTLAVSGYSDIQSLYKQSTTELDRAISVTSSVAPQFFDAYGFIETNDKPMKLHSIPGFDGVI